MQTEFGKGLIENWIYVNGQYRIVRTEGTFCPFNTWCSIFDWSNDKATFIMGHADELINYAKP